MSIKITPPAQEVVDEEWNTRHYIVTCNFCGGKYLNEVITPDEVEELFHSASNVQRLIGLSAIAVYDADNADKYPEPAEASGSAAPTGNPIPKEGLPVL